MKTICKLFKMKNLEMKIRSKNTMEVYIIPMVK